MKDRSEYFKNYREKNKEMLKKINKEYYYANKNEISEKKKKYNQKNKDINKIKKQKYYEENKESKQKYYENNKLDISEKKKQYYKINRDVIINNNIDYIKEKYRTNALFKFKCCVRNMIRLSLTSKGYFKKSKTEEILGCTFLEFQNYIESQFQEWMNWENYGLYNGDLNYGWDIDHKIGLKNCKCEEDIIKLNHFTNLQPLCSYYNRYIKR